MKKKHKDSHSKPYKVRSHDRMKSVVRMCATAVIALSVGMVLFGLVSAFVQ